MPNQSKIKTEMPLLPLEKRQTTFEEVALGYTEEAAIREADRCLNCPTHPCTAGCPVEIDIPRFIQKIKEKDYTGADRIIRLSSSLPAVCGRVCPQETQCEQVCARGKNGDPVAIGRLERFVADRQAAVSTVPKERPSPNGHKVAIIGSGPAGLSCAGALADKGYSITILEALHTAGGVLMYGIPEFRLPKSIVRREVAALRERGVEICTNTVIGRTLSIEELQEQGYEAVFIGSGAGLPVFMGMEGEQLCGVYSANEFLTRVNLMQAFRDDTDTPIEIGKRVIVVGGGNVAMDAARTAIRLGAEDVTVVYRRSRKELPARKEEVEHAEEEGVHFSLLCNPVSLAGGENGFVREMRCIRMELGEPDQNGRRRPVEIPGSEFTIPADTVIIAIGTSPNPLLRNTTPSLSFSARGGIVVNEDGATNLPGVYAGGDAVTGAATVISAMGAGKKAAEAIHRYLSN